MSHPQEHQVPWLNRIKAESFKDAAQIRTGQSAEVQLGECQVVISRPKTVGGTVPKDYPPVVLDDLPPGENPWMD